MKLPEINLAEYEGFEEEKLLDHAEGPPAYLLVSKEGNHIRVSASAWRLLKAVRSGMSLDEVAEKLEGHCDGNSVSREQLEQAYTEVIGKLAAIEKNGSRSALPWGFWWRCRLVSANLAATIARPLSLLYHPLFAVPTVALISAAVVSAWSAKVSFGFKENGFLPAYLMFLLSLMAHEFGHAAAAARYGARPQDIGFAFYLIYPAFYSDVTTAWQLSRRQRVVVDLGGTYFQWIFGAALLAAYQILGWDALRLTFFMIFYTSLFSLNPIFKFDGYWTLADMLGVTNLSSQPSRIGRYLLARLRGKPVRPLPWPLAITIFLIVYSVASTLVWTYFIVRLLPSIWTRAIRCGQLLEGCYRALSTGRLPELSQAEALFASSFVLALTCVMTWQLSRRFYRLGTRLYAPLAGRFRTASPTAGGTV